MIDAMDRETQQLPLEHAKRGRGRPATGKALSPAEKQRAYRERQKAQAGQGASEELEAAKLRIRELEEQLIAAKKTKRHRDEPAAELKEWAVFGKKNQRAKNWTRLTPEGEEFATEAAAIRGINEVPSLGEKAVYSAFKVTLR